MKKGVIALVFFSFIFIPSWACTNLLVGKAASVDGSAMITYSADSYSLYGELYHWPAKTYPEGEMLDVYEWDTGKLLGRIPQVKQTHNVVGNMNEHQLCIGETTFGGRKELTDSTGIMDYGSLIYITLQRAKTAREAIQIMTDLVSEFGYYSEGESFSIADPEEVWIMEMIGKGPGRKGAVWVAVRIPDDCISAHANQARIQQFPLNDPQNCIYSKDVISFAREKGYFSGKDPDFSFAKAYNPLDFGGLRYCEARVWSFFNRFHKEAAKWIDYAKGESTVPMPLYLKPDRKLGVKDLMEMMRNHYEGTELDATLDIGAGPFHSPYRFSPLQWKVGEVEYCFERPISTQQTGFTFIGQVRNYLPNEVGGVLWFGTDDARFTVYTPMYACMTTIPESYRCGNGDLYTYSPTSAFWLHNQVANTAYSRYNQIIQDTKPVQEKLENGFLLMQDPIEQKAAEIAKTDKKQAIEFLTEYSHDQAEKAFRTWKNLGEKILVKYIDGVIKKEENGQFKRNEYGQPAYPERPVYDEEYYKLIIRETGNKLKVKEIK